MFSLQGSSKGEGMSKPSLKWYTIEQLERRWGKFGILRDEIDHYIDTGLLTQYKMFASKENGDPVFLPVPRFNWSDDYTAELRMLDDRDDLEEVFINGEQPYYFLLEEVERFEKDHGPELGGDIAKSSNLSLPTSIQQDTSSGPSGAHNYPVIGRESLCVAFGLKPSSFTAVKRRMSSAGMALRYEYPGKKETTPWLWATEIIEVNDRWEKREQDKKIIL